MTKLSLFFFVSVLTVSVAALADGDGFDDRPRPDENFKAFFQRITRGGPFPGIQLEASEEFQKAFFPRIWRPTWQGRLDKTRKRLQDQGVDLWFDWYKSDVPLPILAPTPESRAELARAMSLAKPAACAKTRSCRNFADLEKVRWSHFSIEERHAFTWAMVAEARLFGGKTLLEYLAQQHGMEAREVLSRVEFRLLNAADFTKAVREIGWEGPIYFRGVTAPVPKNPHRFWILLSDEFMRKLTPFQRPLLQALEYVGILTHELSHVLQNIAAEKLNLDLSIGSVEGAMLVEGEAEWLAEQAMDFAGLAQTYPSALLLFSAEQGSEIVNRPGQATQGNLFPYTVGLPFATALFDLAPTAERKAQLREKILQMIAEKMSLQDLVRDAGSLKSARP